MAQPLERSLLVVDRSGAELDVRQLRGQRVDQRPQSVQSGGARVGAGVSGQAEELPRLRGGALEPPVELLAERAGKHLGLRVRGALGRAHRVGVAIPPARE